MKPTNKRRKVDSKCCIFKDEWTKTFLLKSNENTVYLAYHELLTVLKAFNIKIHYVTKHNNMEKICKKVNGQIKLLNEMTD